MGINSGEFHDPKEKRKIKKIHKLRLEKLVVIFSELTKWKPEFIIETKPYFERWKLFKL
jgi:hypothetical protein